MKTFLLTLLSLSLFIIGFARSLELGINGGMSYNTAPTPHLFAGEYGSKGSGIKPTLTADASYRVHNWKFGITASYTKLYYYPKVSHIDFLYASSYSSGEEWITFGTDRVLLARGVLPVSLTVNRLIPIGRAELFAGANVGYCLASNKTSSMLMKLYGYSLGLDLGCSYRLYRHFGIKAQVQGNYIRLKNSDSNPQHFAVFDFPLTAGVFYSL